MKIDKSHLSPEIIDKQKLKGTYDSPCMSICDYDEKTTICQTCGMSSEEKKTWKVADSLQKQEILKSVQKKRQNMEL
ncbi:MAG: DUF1289 domain-containing protein [Bdellovibrionales bacterium]|nr:DUF1289 domain-containing protein [Bdellovibrionales bacterium]